VAKSQALEALVLDAGALINAEHDERIQHLVAKWVLNGATIFIPAPVIAESLRGSARDANANRLIKAVDRVVATDEAIARHAGELIQKASDTVDAIVVATAQKVGAKNVLTSDPDDMKRLSGGLVAGIRV
jgi:predicted nucleic acid-binding protein